MVIISVRVLEYVMRHGLFTLFPKANIPVQSKRHKFTAIENSQDYGNNIEGNGHSILR
jgi:hypothetical protein